VPKLGFHAFRRFRVTHIRKNMVPEDLIRSWIGHAQKTATDEYSKLKHDVRFRKHVAESVGLGFNLQRQLCPGVPQFSALNDSQLVVESSQRP